ncbi:permease [Oscillospiraceae bacterium LTW-04]|nr:permease [Oscillospiraceae bacterium MB24-C1]
MNILRKAKDNLSIVIIAVSYITLFILRPDMGITSVKNSVYYIKEMIMIMPVIFVLTALLDTWVPKEKIIEYLGQDAKAKGVILSLLLGSISAGPIYAAFPLCVMLHKKGASVRNLVVILSAWAVIKVPMLLNELKFLGFQFMAIRWVLTVIAIVIFSWITAKIVKDKDLPEKSSEHQKNDNEIVYINRAACIGCSLCTKKYPELFEIKNKKASLKKIDEGCIDQEKLMLAIDACPVKVISK